jgi:hypothetical protein
VAEVEGHGGAPWGARKLARIARAEERSADGE